MIEINLVGHPANNQFAHSHTLTTMAAPEYGELGWIKRRIEGFGKSERLDKDGWIRDLNTQERRR